MRALSSRAWAWNNQWINRTNTWVNSKDELHVWIWFSRANEISIIYKVFINDRYDWLACGTDGREYRIIILLFIWIHSQCMMDGSAEVSFWKLLFKLQINGIPCGKRVFGACIIYLLLEMLPLSGNDNPIKTFHRNMEFRKVWEAYLVNRGQVSVESAIAENTWNLFGLPATRRWSLDISGSVKPSVVVRCLRLWWRITVGASVSCKIL